VAEAALLRVDSRNQVLVANGRGFSARGRAGRYAAAGRGLPWPVSRWPPRLGNPGALEAPEDPDAQAEVLNLRSLGPIFDDTSSQLCRRPPHC